MTELTERAMNRRDFIALCAGASALPWPARAQAPMRVVGIWWSPFFAWLLLVSAWATRVPFLWAMLPPVAIGIVERIAFNSTRFATMLQNHFLGGPMTTGDNRTMSMDMLAPTPVLVLFTRPAFWIGVALAAVFLYGATLLRRIRPAL